MARGRMRRKPEREAEHFESRMIQLCDELRLAGEWERPSILFAVCQTETIRAAGQSALAKLLELVGQKVSVVQVDAKKNVDIPLLLSRKHHRTQKVFFVQGLDAGGGAALGALNLRREYLVDKKIRVVFWLTESEEQAVARAAPDFWAFRHQVIYLTDDVESQVSLEQPA